VTFARAHLEPSLNLILYYSSYVVTASASAHPASSVNELCERGLCFVTVLEVWEVVVAEVGFNEFRTGKRIVSYYTVLYCTLSVDRLTVGIFVVRIGLLRTCFEL